MERIKVKKIKVKKRKFNMHDYEEEINFIKIGNLEIDNILISIKEYSEGSISEDQMNVKWSDRQI